MVQGNPNELFGQIHRSPIKPSQGIAVLYRKRLHQTSKITSGNKSVIYSTKKLELVANFKVISWLQTSKWWWYQSIVIPLSNIYSHKKPIIREASQDFLQSSLCLRKNLCIFLFYTLSTILRFYMPRLNHKIEFRYNLLLYVGAARRFTSSQHNNAAGRYSNT